MTCIKCGSPLSPTNKCYTCGNDEQEVTEKVYRRGIPFIIFISLSILSSIIVIILALLVILSPAEETAVLLKVLAAILIVTTSFDIILAVLILMLKKWAFKIYIVFTFINCISSLASFNIFSAVLRGAMPYLIYKYEYKNWK